MNTIIIFTAKYFLVLSGAIMGYFWWTLPGAAKKQFVWRLLAGGTLAYGLAKLAGHLFYNARPFVVAHSQPLFAHAADNGFPSDHTLLSATIAFVVMSFSTRWGSVLLAVSFLIGLARVAAHVHHLIDILGAIAIAGIAVWFVIMVFKKFWPEHKPAS